MSRPTKPRTLLAEEPERWRHINIPVIAEARIPDALGREPGVAMTSALGRTADHFDDLRRSVGSRRWYALFQGAPSEPEGGLVKPAWLDDWRLPAAPQRPLLTVVGVDPADSGQGDACGLIAASMTTEGVVVERLELRARRHDERLEHRAATRPCRVCGYCCLNPSGSTCYYYGNDQVRDGEVEHRATNVPPAQRTTTSASTPAARHVSERAGYAGVRIEQAAAI